MFSGKAEEYFFGSYHFEKQTKLFKKLLYILIVVKCVYWLYYFDLFFSENSIVYIRRFISGSVSDFAFLLTNHNSVLLTLVFILGALTLSILLLFISSTYIAELAVWFFILNIHNRVYPTLSGGDYLLTQLLFFNIFLCNNRYTGTEGSKLRPLLHNFSAISVITQVCLVYFLSAMAKVADNTWLNGGAIQTIGGVNHFTTGNSTSWPAPVYFMLNYFVLGYQLLFPLLALFNRTKLPFLFTGIVMHLYIAFVTGIPGFSLVMLLSYVYFWPMKPVSAKK